MKSILKYILPVFLVLGSIACKKTDNAPGSNVVYQETIQDIQKNEPVLLTFNNSNNTAKVTWVVDPSGNSITNTVGNSATITFSVSGTFKVTATAGSVSAVYTVIVNNIEYVDYGTTFNLSASKQVNIEIGEPILFSVHNAAAPGSQITWQIDPIWSTISSDTAKNTKTVTFSSGGLKTVTASDGIHTQSKSIWITDPANANPDKDTVPFILGEKLQLTPSIISIAGAKQLVMQASTTNTYHCPTDKILSFASSFDYTLDYLGVVISPQPCSPTSVATSSNSFSSIPAGIHPFTINFGNNTYAGSLDVSASGIYTFTWPDERSVRISPLVVQ